MSRQPGFDRLSAVVWPETAPPEIIEPGSAALAIMAQAVPPGGLLLTGAARATARPEDGVWNSLLVVDGTGAIAAHYDKVHLVPLGEYIPFHKQLAPVSGMIGRGSFEVGEGRVTLVPTNGLPSFSPIICYEVIFPAAVTGPGAAPAVAAQHHQRCLVRPDERTVPTLDQRAVAHHRGRPADDSRRQHRRIGSDRCLRSRSGVTRHATGGHHRPPPSRDACGHALRPLGRLDTAGSGCISFRDVNRNAIVEEPTTPMNHSTLGIPRISLHSPGQLVMSYAALTCRYAFLHR